MHEFEEKLSTTNKIIINKPQLIKKTSQHLPTYLCIPKSILLFSQTNITKILHNNMTLEKLHTTFKHHKSMHRTPLILNLTLLIL